MSWTAYSVCKCESSSTADKRTQPYLDASVGNSGKQPYTTSGLAITHTLSETSPPVFYSFRALSIRPSGLFQQPQCLMTSSGPVITLRKR